MRLLAKSRVPKAVCNVIRSSTDSQLKCRPPPRAALGNGTTVTHRWQIMRPIAMTAPALVPILTARGRLSALRPSRRRLAQRGPRFA